VIELEVDEVGPSLRYATATVSRAARSGGPAAGDDARATADAGSDQPPF